MRTLVVISLVAAALAATAPAAGAARPSYANFKVTVKGTETTTVTGREDCQDDAGTIAAAKASESAQFSTPKPRTLQFHRAGRAIDVALPRGVGASTIAATGSMTRQSDFVPNGSTPPVCGGPPNPGCGTSSLSRISLLVQGGLNSVHLSADKLQPRPGECFIPALAFPAMPGTTQMDGLHARYRAKVPAGLLNPHKHVVVIHGSGTATQSGQEGAIFMDSTSTTLNFTMRLVRVPLH
ncbi:MAG TPA: hypothetical protein VF032_17655 [Thermoleophilaceae bacterium]